MPQLNGGASLVHALKDHVLHTMQSDPTCHPEGRGLGNVELERLCGLELSLPSQDHYLTYSILQALILDGLVESVRHDDAPRNPKYRLKISEVQ